MKFMVPRLALRYAARFKPTICQDFKSVFDPIVPIHLGDFEPSLLSKPTVYFAVKQDQQFRYLLYCFFHRKDWSTWIPPFKALDEHEYDFEGCLIRRSKEGTGATGISVFHNNFTYRKNPWGMGNSTVVKIEAGGHGVEFHNYKGRELENRIFYDRYKLVNMANPSTLKWLKKDVQPAFNPTGVKLPWQWNDENLVTHFGRERTEGLMWRNPKLLFKLAKEAKLL